MTTLRRVYQWTYCRTRQWNSQASRRTVSWGWGHFWTAVGFSTSSRRSLEFRRARCKPLWSARTGPRLVMNVPYPIDRYVWSSRYVKECVEHWRAVPIWSAVTVMGIKLKDINRDIGTKSDPESWGELHAKVIESDKDLITRKGYRCWGIGICAAEVVDAIVRNTCICITLSTYLKVTIRSTNFLSTSTGWLLIILRVVDTVWRKMSTCLYLV